MNNRTSTFLKMEVQYDRQLITKLSKVQNRVSGRTRQIVIVITALVCFMISLRLIGNVQSPINYLFAVYGCFSLAFIGVPAKWRAERICDAIEKSSSGYPCSIFSFDEESFSANTRGNNGSPVKNPYKTCHKLIETSDTYYYFANKDAAFPIPFSCIPDGRKGELKAYLEQQTGLSFVPLRSLWNLSLQSLLFERKNTR